MSDTKPYHVLVKREAGNDPLTGTFLDDAEEELIINARSSDEAYRKSQASSSLKFFGQVRRTFIDGEEYFDTRH